MRPRHEHTRALRHLWTGVVGLATCGVVGICLLAAGIVVLTRPPAVTADSFGPTMATKSVSSTPRSSDDTTASDRSVDQQRAATMAPALVPPASVSFPTDDVVADVVPVGVLPTGAVQIPDNPAQVGWWAAGALPGQRAGSVVLVGHMVGSGGSGAMNALLDVQNSAMIIVEDHHGLRHPYRVVSRTTAPSESLDAGLFATTGPHRLVLITCGGTFDEDTGRYTENTIVVAEPVRN